MQNKIRVLLIDDHGLFRESLSRLLESEGDFEIVGSVSSVEEALRLLNATQPDVVLLDQDLGDELGESFLARSSQAPGRVLLVTAGMTSEAMSRALASGAFGIFLKHSPPGDLIQAIRGTVAGERWIDPKAEVVLTTERTAHRRMGARPFTARERAVLRGVFEGLANKEIAGDLQLSESSVKAVLQQLFAKTGVRSRSQLVRIVLEEHREDLFGSSN